MKFSEIEKRIINELDITLQKISDEEINALVKEIKKAQRVFFVGVGRVLLSLQAIAKRLAHIGIDTVVVGQITEPAITDKDLLIVGSGSGESAFPLAIVKKAKFFNATIVHIGSNPSSSMRESVDIFVRIPVQTKLNLSDEIKSIQPMTSLFEQALLILGDSIALGIIEDEKLNMHDLWQYHANLE